MNFDFCVFKVLQCMYNSDKFIGASFGAQYFVQAYPG